MLASLGAIEQEVISFAVDSGAAVTVVPETAGRSELRLDNGFECPGDLSSGVVMTRRPRTLKLHKVRIQYPSTCSVV